MDDENEEAPESLSGSLILAAPTLVNPHFSRSVLLLTDHGGEGAHGYILNRPLGKTVSDVLNEPNFEQLKEVPLFLGGPVSTGQLTFASLTWNHQMDELDYATHLSVGEASARIAEGFHVRAFVGYSGWSEGQLEDELKQDAWIPKTPISEILNIEDTDHLWADILRTMGPYYRMIADAPEDPSLN